MDTAWIAPPTVLIAGSAAIAVLARRLTAAVKELRAAQRRLGRVEQSLIPIRVESRRVAASRVRMQRR
ncbi:MAG: hypothetical protein ACR2MB_15325 [Acidimicrobiales bacterium]